MAYEYIDETAGRYQYIDDEPSTMQSLAQHGKKALKALNEGRASITMNKGK